MASKPKPPPDRSWPCLTPEQMNELLRELKELQEAGEIHYKSKGYPSLGEKGTIH